MEYTVNETVLFNLLKSHAHFTKKAYDNDPSYNNDSPGMKEELEFLQYMDNKHPEWFKRYLKFKEGE